MTKAKQAILMIADSIRDADMYYATRFLAPDPFIFMQVGGKKTIYVSDLEVGRVRDEAGVDEVESTSVYRQRAQRSRGKKTLFIDVLVEILKERRLRALLVPSQFRVGQADALRKRGFRITVKEGAFYPQRFQKTPQELIAITESVRHAERALLKAIALIHKSTIKRGALYYEGKILTSEKVRRLIHVTLLENDCEVEGTIISCGPQSANPHSIGFGPLRPHQPIIVDIFPRSSRSRYYADLTRTVVKGVASPRLRKMYQAVARAQRLAISRIKGGSSGHAIWREVVHSFDESGFKTANVNGQMEGFFHGVGHGVGLEIHEPPRIGPSGDKLKVGEVITVEPGLYYHDIGGVRIEDMVVVTERGARRLSKLPYIFKV